ncbi:MAG TPA: phospholipase D-like domain-containing protein, partial [Alphaproteobacteria bacterium]
MDISPPYFFTRTQDIWEAMYADCQRAQQSIELDQYILEDDAIGRRFFSLFAEKARAGVSVHLLLDYIGSYKAYNSEPLQDLIAAGGTVRFYNKLPKHKWLQPTRWFPRNHVKVLMIDSHIAYVGSACMRDDMAGWRDTTVRLTGNDAGPVEKRMAYARLLWWKRPIGVQVRSYQDRDGQFAFSIRSPGVGVNPIYRGIIHAIRRAKKSVWIATPYFL